MASSRGWPGLIIPAGRLTRAHETFPMGARVSDDAGTTRSGEVAKIAIADPTQLEGRMALPTA